MFCGVKKQIYLNKQAFLEWRLNRSFENNSKVDLSIKSKFKKKNTIVTMIINGKAVFKVVLKKQNKYRYQHVTVKEVINVIY